LKITRVTLDHVQPLSRGGHHTPENVKVCCEACNMAKDNKTLAEYLETR
jgi:5-methylcytosine-specific restriction endonuclease McrA